MSVSLEQVLVKLWASVEVTGVCWNWQGAVDRYGYGKVSSTRFGTRKAHRVVYSLLTQTDAGKELDHLCRNRCCVNPDHLLPGSRQANLQRIPSAVWSNRNRLRSVG